MPAQNLSAVARAAKPKQPSKAQLVMEQLKASMEAEKQRPKKEVLPKVQAQQAVATTTHIEGMRTEEQRDTQEITGKLKYFLKYVNR